MTTIRRVVVTLAALASIALAGAAGVHAADPTIGAAVESRVFTDEDRALRVANRSDVTATFDFTATDEWRIVPGRLVLDAGASGQVVVVGDGEDGAPVTVTITSAQPAPQGTARSAIQLTSRIYHARPFDPAPLVWGALAAVLALLVLIVVARRARRIASRYSFRVERRDPAA